MDWDKKQKFYIKRYYIEMNKKTKKKINLQSNINFIFYAIFVEMIYP